MLGGEGGDLLAELRWIAKGRRARGSGAHVDRGLTCREAKGSQLSSALPGLEEAQLDAGIIEGMRRLKERPSHRVLARTDNQQAERPPCGEISSTGEGRSRKS